MKKRYLLSLIPSPILYILLVIQKKEKNASINIGVLLIINYLIWTFITFLVLWLLGYLPI